MASADTGSGSDNSKARTSTSSSDKSDRTGPRRPSGRADDSTGTGKIDTPDEADKPSAPAKRARADRGTKQRDTTADETSTPEAGTPRTAGSEGNQGSEALDPPGTGDSPEPAVIVDDVPPAPAAGPDDAQTEIEPTEPEPTPAESGERQAKMSVEDEPVLEQAATSGEARVLRTMTVAPEAAAMAFAPRLPSLPDLIQSFVFDFIGVAVTFIAGPPMAPPGSNVTVRKSSLEITEGRHVPAHWYYPEGDEPPERMILLQHGFLGVGAMYSHTAANLAKSTNSIVVVPTYTSNRYVRDGFWLGDDQLYRATADLFLGDRDALTASAMAAGLAKKYGADAALPETFMLVGHSLGAGVVAGAAGYYADAIIASGGDNHLTGLILLDGAPPGTSLPDALDKLDGLDAYIPVLELGAPKESRRVDAALNEHRPGMFNGVVLTDGKHLDAMLGGTRLIQFISHLYQGFPTEQNKAAAQTIIAGWANDILDGRIDALTGKCEGADCAGIYGDAGQTIDLTTTKGPTSAVVIGSPGPVPLTEFQPTSADAVVAPRPSSGRSLLLRL